MKKKIFLSTIISLALLLSVAAGSYAATKMTLIVNGSVAKVDPILIKGVTYVPLRAAAELLGAEVGYTKKTNTVTVDSYSFNAAETVLEINEYGGQDLAIVEEAGETTAGVSFTQIDGIEADSANIEMIFELLVGFGADYSMVIYESYEGDEYVEIGTISILTNDYIDYLNGDISETELSDKWIITGFEE
ncbi:stalk domain-containing protein [Paenibacillus abyssi]|uniref:Copper amine oxidase-like N-terminal domain-containing protein n=1 Tax=Paenibacillus abyssi TaxID=1340531 RepID=A0A917G4F0_9BACL|nr:stalk domain-containing protein [Paenibacillus abyssi]GGG22048.1 hypothetical protein GCM10010916_43380 [Paenibacillus abyssi]